MTITGYTQDHRAELAAAFCRAAGMNLRGGMATRFNQTLDDSGTHVPTTLGRGHFARLGASDLLLIMGGTVDGTSHRICAFEPAAETCIRVLQTSQPPRMLNHESARKTARGRRPAPWLICAPSLTTKGPITLHE